MGMTMTQEILAAHVGLDHVKTGQLIEVNLDMVLGSDIASPVTIREFEKYGFSQMFDPGKTSTIMDHFAPNKGIEAAQQCGAYRTFTYAKNIEYFYDAEEMGIEHALPPEKGTVRPEECIIGADSRTCMYGTLDAFSTGVDSTDIVAGIATGKCWFKIPEAIRFDLRGRLAPHVSGEDVILHIIGIIGVGSVLYKSMEFSGISLQSLGMDDCLCVANTAIEASAKNGVFVFDEITEAYVKDRVSRPCVTYEADVDAEYYSVYHLDLSQITHTAAFPYLSEDTRTIDEIREPVRTDQVVIGSCIDGWLFDMARTARISKGQHVAKGVRAIITPTTQEIYKQCIQLGYTEILIDAGCVMSIPTCNPCLGDYMGVLAKNEHCVVTTNRSLVGRMEHVDSEVYLASPAATVASAITGRIAAPKEIA